jgi:hypothetical protein
MDTDSTSVHGRSGTLIVILVIVGIAVLGAGGYLAYSKRHSSDGGGGGSDESSRWCQIRQEWQKQADPLAADIMLKSVKDEDRTALEQLVLKRNKLASDYGKRIGEVSITDANLAKAIAKVEEALAKEGKTRANLAVEVHNALAKEGEVDDVSALGKTLTALRDQLNRRIQEGKASADREVAAAVAATGTACPGLYRGPATDAGTSDSPYITWDELEMRRAHAQKVIEEKLRTLEPLEEYTNRVYHELIRQHVAFIKGCYKKGKAKNAKMSDTLGLRIRLKRSGEVKTLAIEWQDVQEEVFLDCLLEKASKWKLPRPDAKTEVVVVTIDFTKI